MCSTDSTVLGTGAAARERSPVLGSSPAKSAFLQGVQSSANAATPRSPRIFSFHANSTITSPPTTPTRPAVSKDSSLTPNHSPPTERAPHSSPGKFLRSLKPLEVLEPDAELANFLKKHDTGFTRADVDAVWDVNEWGTITLEGCLGADLNELVFVLQALETGDFDDLKFMLPKTFKEMLVPLVTSRAYTDESDQEVQARVKDTQNKSIDGNLNAAKKLREKCMELKDLETKNVLLEGEKRKHNHDMEQMQTKLTVCIAPDPSSAC